MTGISTRRAIERCEQLAALGPPPPLSRPWKLSRWLRSYRAIMATDITELGEMLREVYPASSINEAAARANPTAALLATPSRSWAGGSSKSWGGK